MLKHILSQSVNIDENKLQVEMITRLDREQYEELKKFLNLLGGCYSTSDKKFHFSSNPKEQINEFIKTGITPKKNPTAFFPTPRIIIDEMIEMSFLDCLPSEEEYQSRIKILEPSVGQGAIADVIKEYAPFANTDMVEILESNQEVLKAKGYDPICCDFLEYNKDFSKKYDYILMNPPYQGKTFIKHIQHAYNMLDKNGILTAVIPTSFLTGSDKLSKWLYEKATQLGEISNNPSGSFSEQGTNVETCIISINNATAEWRKEEYEGCTNYWVWQVWLSLYSSGDVYRYLEDLEYNPQTKEKIKAMILKELDNYKKSYSYFSYSYIDDYTDKIFEHYCYIHEIPVEDERKSIRKQIESAIYAEAQREAFKKGTLF